MSHLKEAIEARALFREVRGVDDEELVAAITANFVELDVRGNRA